MSNIQATTQKAMPGFWKRLAIGIEEASISHDERIEMRIRRLETEIARLTATQKAREKT